MIAMQRPRKTARRWGQLVAFATVVVLLVAAPTSRAATQQYFDTNGTAAGFGSAGTFNWGGSFWTTASNGTTATGAYHNDATGSGYGFPRFHPSGIATISIASGSTYHTVGFYQYSTSTNTLNIVSSGGTLTVESPGGAAINGGLLNGVFVNSTGIEVYAPIAGDGGITQHGAGELSFYGHNTFSGGYSTTGGQVTNYNNNQSFGTGTITVEFTGQGFVNNGGTGVVINNPLVFGTEAYGAGTATYAASAMNFVGGAGSGSIPGTKWTGNVYLPPSSGVTTIWQQGNASTDISEFSGVISGGSDLQIGDATATRGTIVLSGANTLTGKIILLNNTLKLGAANTIASIPELHADGGTIDPSSYVHVMSNTALVLFQETAGSGLVVKIDGSAGGQIQFAESTNIWDWGGVNTLNVIGQLGTLRFGTDSSGLRSDQLAQIEFNSDSSTLGSGWLTNDGYLVPEPSSLAFALIGAPLLLRRRRRVA